MTDLFAALRAPFPPDRVSWRLGSTNADKTKGMALAYIDARDVMDRLDSVIGPGAWQCSYPHANGKTICSIGIKVGDEWVWKADGAGDTDVEAEKGAISDAFKRAAVKWGIGRYLYELPSPWVSTETRGRTAIIKDSEYAKLRALLAKGATQHAPAEGDPPSAERDAERDKEIEAELARSASKGMRVLRAAWESLAPDDKAHFKGALDRRFKPSAEAADKADIQGEAA